MFASYQVSSACVLVITCQQVCRLLGVGMSETMEQNCIYMHTRTRAHTEFV